MPHDEFSILQLHQILIESGFKVSQNELLTFSHGKTTIEAVKAFQASHTASNGHALAVDGVVGTKTTWALLHPGESTRGRFTAPGWRCYPSSARGVLPSILTASVSEIGNCENPARSNRGKSIDKYGGNGAPWCAYFVSWCYRQCADGSPFGVLGSAYKILEWGKANKRLVAATSVIIPGDVFVILRGDFHGHVGIIGGIDQHGNLSTIEGNSSNAVRGLIRNRGEFTGIVRPIPVM